MNLVHHCETGVLVEDTKKVSQGPQQAMTAESTTIYVLDNVEFLNKS
jgi:hypothetical protein